MRLEKLSPILWTKNLEETISFYETVLGFAARSNFPNFASLTNGNVEIMFIVPEEEPEVPFSRPALTGSIFITTEQVDKLWERVKDKAVIKTSIADREYWMRDFSILDNNGYELVFGEDISR